MIQFLGDQEQHPSQYVGNFRWLHAEEIMAVARHWSLQQKTLVERRQILEEIRRRFNESEDAIAEISQWDIIHRFPGIYRLRLSSGGNSERWPSEGEEGQLTQEVFFSFVPSYPLVWADDAVIFADVEIENIRYASYAILTAESYRWGGDEPEIKARGKIFARKVFFVKTS